MASTAVAIVRGPVAAGTVLSEARPTNDTEEAVTLTVPSTAGTYYVFFIDDNPELKYAHPVRFAYVNQDDGTTQSVDAKYPMLITPPGESADDPYVFSATGTVNDVQFNYAERGEGAGDAADVSGKGTLEDGTDAVTTQGTRTQNAKTEGTLPQRLQVTQETENCEKLALVVDGGEIKGAWYQSQLADNMAEDGDTMATWLTGQGFTVDRYSQYWGNSHPGFASPEGTNFLNRVQAYVDHFNSVGCEDLGDCFCHEFFIYIASHGESDGFIMHPADGSEASQFVFYTVLMNTLSNLHRVTEMQSQGSSYQPQLFSCPGQTSLCSTD